MDEILSAAKSYHEAGFAVHWLYARSKRPIGTGWQLGARQEWTALEQSYQKGNNLGVRLGTPSKIGELGYLACLDVDVHGEQFRAEAQRALRVALSELGWTRSELPASQVISGKGWGSGHFYFVTDRPFRQLTFRRTAGWEIVAYSDGRQMVLPPSIHPETGRNYRWKKENAWRDLPRLEVPVGWIDNNKKERTPSLGNFKPVDGAELLLVELSPEIRAMIVDADVDDRSSALMPVTRALLSAGASREEVLTILTDPKFALSSCAYDHARTGDRQRAADWLWKYTVERLWRESRAEGIFQPVRDGAPKDPPRLVEALAIKEQQAELGVSDRPLHTSRDGKIMADCHNAVVLMEEHLGTTALWFDEFSRRIHWGVQVPWGEAGRPFVDSDAHHLQHWFSSRFRLNIGPQLIWTAVSVLANKNAVHPVRNYLKGLDWDGVPRVDTWLRDYLGAEMPEPYLTEVSRKFLVASVARIFEPGCKFDHILVLEGAQGIGKSTAVAELAGPWGLGSLPNIRDKDALIALQGIWWVEISELATLRRVDVESYKAFFSASVDKFRVPYSRGWEEFPRQCVFIGTTNHDDYLSDNTGNRRFWPVKVTRYEFGSLKRDRDLLYAEARVLWETFREPLHLSGEAHHQALELQLARVADNEEMAMTTALDEWLERQKQLPADERMLDIHSRFRLQVLFSIDGPWPKERCTNWTMQLASRALRARGFRRTVSCGRAFWRAPIEPHHLYPY
jgi:hypothetical protein